MTLREQELGEFAYLISRQGLGVWVSSVGVLLLTRLIGPTNHDFTVFEDLPDGSEPTERHGRGRRRKRPGKLHADKGYDDFGCCRDALRRRGFESRISWRGFDSSERQVALPVGARTDLSAARQVPEAGGALRTAGRPPRGVLTFRLFLNLPHLPVVTVLQDTLSFIKLNRYHKPAGKGLPRAELCASFRSTLERVDALDLG